MKSVDEVLPYGGKPQPRKEWERDMGLREAIKMSNVPIYQELARRIGIVRMREGKLRLDGDLPAIVAHVEAAKILVGLAASIPTDFPDD